MARVIYNPEMRETEHGRRLYAYWKKVKNDTDSPKFLRFPDFCEWALNNGYVIGARLFRRYPFEPFSPENCFWVAKGEREKEGAHTVREYEREKEWDAVVNRIRLHYGMEPIHSPEV